MDRYDQEDIPSPLNGFVTALMLKNPGGIERFITVLSWNSQAVRLHTSSIHSLQFCYMRASYMQAHALASLVDFKQQ